MYAAGGRRVLRPFAASPRRRCCPRELRSRGLPSARVEGGGERSRTVKYKTALRALELEATAGAPVVRKHGRGRFCSCASPCTFVSCTSRPPCVPLLAARVRRHTTHCRCTRPSATMREVWPGAGQSRVPCTHLQLHLIVARRQNATKDLKMHVHQLRLSCGPAFGRVGAASDACMRQAAAAHRLLMLTARQAQTQAATFAPHAGSVSRDRSEDGMQGARGSAVAHGAKF